MFVKMLFLSSLGLAACGGNEIDSQQLNQLPSQNQLAAQSVSDTSTTPKGESIIARGVDPNDCPYYYKACVNSCAYHHSKPSCWDGCKHQLDLCLDSSN